MLVAAASDNKKGDSNVLKTQDPCCAVEGGYIVKRLGESSQVLAANSPSLFLRIFALCEPPPSLVSGRVPSRFRPLPEIQNIHKVQLAGENAVVSRGSSWQRELQAKVWVPRSLRVPLYIQQRCAAPTAAEAPCLQLSNHRLSGTFLKLVHTPKHVDSEN